MRYVFSLLASVACALTCSATAYADSAAGYGAPQVSQSSAGYGTPQAPQSSAGYGAPSDSSASYGDHSNQNPSNSSAHYGNPGVPVPPVSVTPNMPPVNVTPSYVNNQISWVNMRGRRSMPRYAVTGGYQPQKPHNLYVCRASYMGGVHPGKALAGKCNITWGGQEVVLPGYEVLISHVPLIWIPAANGSVPATAVAGGFENNRTLYVCQADYNGGVHTGKIVGQNCNIGWGGREISLPMYRVLSSQY